jgi:two-component sensor histidine kinase
MQLRRLKDHGSSGELDECKKRIQAIALVHEKLYQSKHFTSVPLPEYVRSLAGDIIQASNVSREVVSFELSVEDIALPIDKAIPCGLILNELISNALKHAFPGGRPGSIRILFARVDANCLRLTVADDGVGMPIGGESHRRHCMGLQLVNMLAEQLHAQLEVTVQGGTSFQLTFPIEG